MTEKVEFYQQTTYYWECPDCEHLNDLYDYCPDDGESASCENCVKKFELKGEGM